MYIPRRAADALRSLAADHPIVAVTGPRGSGKTTLVRELFPGLEYVSLEDPVQREFALDDPLRFLGGYPDGAVLDAVHRAPDLLSYLQEMVNQDSRPGRFILTASHRFGTVDLAAESLARKIAHLSLLPFSLGELGSEGLASDNLEEMLFVGLYPRVHDQKLDSVRWYGDYISTYIEQELRQLITVRDLTLFQRFLRMCGSRTGSLLNLSGLAADCGITHNTARAWIAVLEASYLVFLLRPHHASFKKRIVKTPKLYFHDVGIAAWLLGVQKPSDLTFHPMRGALFENWVVSELLKMRFNAGLRSNLFFWKGQAGLEVSCVVELGSRLVPVEVRSGETLSSDAFLPLWRWQNLAGETGDDGWLVYGGSAAESRERARSLPYRSIGEMEEIVVPWFHRPR